MSLRRILVTGSRDWEDYRTVHRELMKYITENSPLVDGGGLPVDWVRQGWVIVHGNCPTGADHWANEFALNNWIEVEPHPADWRLGRGAGFLRNEAMVDAGADVCLAFLKPCTKRDCARVRPHGSHGTTHCMTEAERAGIEVRVVTS